MRFDGDGDVGKKPFSIMENFFVYFNLLQL